MQSVILIPYSFCQIQQIASLIILCSVFMLEKCLVHTSSFVRNKQWLAPNHEQPQPQSLRGMEGCGGIGLDDMHNYQQSLPETELWTASLNDFEQAIPPPVVGFVFSITYQPIRSPVTVISSPPMPYPFSRSHQKP